MFAKLAKLAEPRTIESRRATLGARRLIHSGDNRRSVGPNSAGGQNRRQMLVCSWHWGPDDGRLECSWHIEPAEDSLGDRAGRWSPIANAHRAHDSHARDSVDTGTAAAPVLLMTGIVLAIGMAIPFTSLGASVGLQPLRINYFPWFIATTAELLPAHPHYKDHLHPKVRQMALISTSGADQERTRYVVQQAHLSTTFEPRRRLGG